MESRSPQVDVEALATDFSKFMSLDHASIKADVSVDDKKQEMKMFGIEDIIH